MVPFWAVSVARCGVRSRTQETPSLPVILAKQVMSGGAKHRILVVDDEPNIVELISMALGFNGFTVESAADGREAIAKAASFKPHLMILDVMMPDMDGFEVAKRLGAQRAGIPIIFLSARDSTQDKVRPRPRPAAGFPRAPLRAVLALRGRTRARACRRRSRPGDRTGHRDGARRDDQRRGCAGRRRSVCRLTAARVAAALAKRLELRAGWVSSIR